MPLNKRQTQVNLLPANNIKMFNFAENSEAQCVFGVVVRGRCVAKPGLLAPQPSTFCGISAESYPFLCMHTSVHF